LLSSHCSALSRLLIYAVAAVGCGLAVGANSPQHPWLMTFLGAAVMLGVLYALERTWRSRDDDANGEEVATDRRR